MKKQADTKGRTTDRSKPRKYERRVDEGGRVRDAQVKINMTSEEKAALDKKAAELKMTKQQFILNSIFSAQVFPAELCEALKVLSRTIADTNIIFQKELLLFPKMDAKEAVAVVESHKKEMEAVWLSLRLLLQRAEAVPGKH